MGANLRFLILNKTIQPTEYAKLVVVIVLSYSITETFQKDMFDYFLFSVHSLLIWVLIILIAMQPDYGTVLILIITAFSMLIAARRQAKKAMIIMGVSLVLGGIFFLEILFLLKDVIQKLRNEVQCPPKKLVVAGQGANIPKIDNLFEKQLNIKTFTKNAFVPEPMIFMQTTLYGMALAVGKDAGAKLFWNA